jgi:DNA-binding NtrC family response regulator
MTNDPFEMPDPSQRTESRPCGGNCKCGDRAPHPSRLPAILVVDDDAEFLESLRSALEKTGRCRVLTAPDATQALKAMKTTAVAAVVTDHYMPHRTGVGLLQHIRSHFPGVRRLLMSGRATKTVLAGAINRANAHQYLAKNMRPDLMIDAVLRETNSPI